MPDASYQGTLPPHPECRCGHDEVQHHCTEAGRRTFCTVGHSLRRLTRCGCQHYQEATR